jgi:cell wall-associated NlpC family hydrolase
VKTSTGKTGYVSSQYLTRTGPAKSSGSAATSGGSTAVNSSGNAIVDLAYKALGVRYVRGSSSMSGFDCSGLTSWVYRQVGISVPRSTSGYYTIGESAALADIQLGDIICMDTRRHDGKTSITHVGIYVGNGNMIHASSTNHRVVLQNLSQYLGWGVKLITIRRIPN